MNEKVTIAIDKLLGINSSAWITLGAACGALVWIGIWAGDLYSRLSDVEGEQSPTRLCERVSNCGTNGSAAIWEMKGQIAALQQKLEERGYRIATLETHVASLMNSPKARPDPFTGTMGRELEARIQALEGKAP